MGNTENLRRITVLLLTQRFTSDRATAARLKLLANNALVLREELATAAGILRVRRTGEGLWLELASSVATRRVRLAALCEDPAARRSLIEWLAFVRVAAERAEVGEP